MFLIQKTGGVINGADWKNVLLSLQHHKQADTTMQTDLVSRVLSSSQHKDHSC